MKRPKRLYDMSEEERIIQSDKYAVLEAERSLLGSVRKKKKKDIPERCQICGLPPGLCVCKYSIFMTAK